MLSRWVSERLDRYIDSPVRFRRAAAAGVIGTVGVAAALLAVAEATGSVWVAVPLASLLAFKAGEINSYRELGKNLDAAGKPWPEGSNR